MSNSASTPPISRESFDAAAGWWLLLQKDPSLADSHEFLNWAATAQNQAALEAVKSSMAVLHEDGSTPSLMRMRAAALSRFGQGNSARWYLRRDILVGGAAASAAAVLVGLFKLGDSAIVQQYATEISERRNIRLSDGTRVALDANTQISADFTADTRSVNLLRGRARFDVVHEENRPFQVSSGDQTVMAIGTAFNVEKLTEKTVITLLEGHVLVQTDSKAAKSNRGEKPLTSLSPGEQLVVAPDGTSVLHPVNLQTETAWQDGRLVFRGRPLVEAAEQVNRYTARPLQVDPSVARVPISGVFNAGDIAAFVTAVTEYLPVSAMMGSTGTITLKHRI